MVFRHRCASGDAIALGTSRQDARRRRRPREAGRRLSRMPMGLSQLRRPTTSTFSLEGLRKFDDPDFNIKQLFRLHRRSEEIARCKVQALEADYAVDSSSAARLHGPHAARPSARLCDHFGPAELLAERCIPHPRNSHELAFASRWWDVKVSNGGHGVYFREVLANWISSAAFDAPIVFTIQTEMIKRFWRKLRALFRPAAPRGPRPSGTAPPTPPTSKNRTRFSSCLLESWTRSLLRTTLDTSAPRLYNAK